MGPAPRDIYYRSAKELHLRSRSYFKLKHIHEFYNILQGVTKCVDLGAAPGGWSQYLDSEIGG